MRILAVDDSPISRDLIPMIFATSGFPPVHVAESGHMALSILSNGDEKFDCLVLDIEMPEMDGIELCARIRRLPRYRDTPIIMLTARDDADTIEAAFAAGANDYIFKRSTAKDLVGRVHVAKRMLHRNDCMVLQDMDRDHGPQARSLRSGHHKFALSDSLLVEGVERLILPFSLGNYLTQLPSEALSDVRLFGVQIEDPIRHYYDNTTPDFVDILERCAGGIRTTVNTERLLMAYQGNGAFYCIARNIDPGYPPELEAGINSYLETCENASALAALQSVRVCVGTPITPNARRGQRVRLSFDRVQERMDARTKIGATIQPLQSEQETAGWR